MNNYFLQTIEHLRHYEEVILYNKLFLPGDEQEVDTVAYLEREYENERLNYPFSAPVFDPVAALWASKIFYTSAQLLLYREHKTSDVYSLLPSYPQELTASAILSADLVLRFLPDIIEQLKAIDVQDKVAEILESHLKIWHYSAIRYSLPVDELNFNVVTTNKCLLQLYIDRVIAGRKMKLATHPQLVAGVKAALGIYSHVYWKDFKHVHNITDEFNR